MNIRHLTFRLLQVFVTVVATGSYSEAARRLHLTQPTVSQQLKRLAEAVGVPLLIAQGSQWQLTDAGRELYRACVDVLGRFDDFDDYLNELEAGKKGRFSIALVNTAQYVLPRILGPYSHAFPQVEVTVEIGNRQQVLARFERQLDDLYVFSHPPASEATCAGRFLRNPLVVVAPKGHPEAECEHLTLSSLLHERFLLREPGSASRMLFESWLQNQGLTLGATLQMASNEAIRIGVSSGMGLAVLSRHVLPAQDVGLTILPVAGFPLESHWHFIARRDRRLPRAAFGFLQFVEQSLDQCLDPQWTENHVGDMLKLLG